jgi:hypothetical protein
MTTTRIAELEEEVRSLKRKMEEEANVGIDLVLQNWHMKLSKLPKDNNNQNNNNNKKFKLVILPWADARELDFDNITFVSRYLTAPWTYAQYKKIDYDARTDVVFSSDAMADLIPDNLSDLVVLVRHGVSFRIEFTDAEKAMRSISEAAQTLHTATTPSMHDPKNAGFYIGFNQMELRAAVSWYKEVICEEGGSEEDCGTWSQSGIIKMFFNSGNVSSLNQIEDMCNKILLQVKRVKTLVPFTL